MPLAFPTAVNASFGVPPYAFSAVGLPAGVTASPNASGLALSGVPSAATGGGSAATFAYASTTIQGVTTGVPSSPAFQTVPPTAWDKISLPSNINPAGQLVTVVVYLSAVEASGAAGLNFAVGNLLFSIATTPSGFFPGSLNFVETAKLLALPGAVLQSSLQAVPQTHLEDTIVAAHFNLSFVYTPFTAPAVFSVTDAAGATASLPACPFTVAAGA